MLNVIFEHRSDIMIGAIVFIVLTAVIVKMVRDKKNQKSSCGCSCSGCKGTVKCEHDD